MASEWRKVRLGEVVDINPDSIRDDWPYSFIKYIDISSIGEGGIIEPPRVLALKEAPSRAKRLVREGDTILSTVRPNRRSMLFAKRPEPAWVVSTGFAVLRPRREHIEPRYLYACVFDKSFTEYLISREKGAAYPAVLPEDIADATINLPPLPEQRAIAHILGTLDDKIELNRRMSETLEQMARALFKAWFVDFEPVRAKMEGRWRRGESLPGLPAHLYDLFPDRLVDSELGEIPEGWRVGSVYEIADVIYGAPFSSSQFNSEGVGEPLIRIRDLPTESPSVYTTELHPKGYKVQPGDIVVGMDGGFRAYLWGGPEAWLNQRICVFKPKSGYSAAFVRNSIMQPLADVESTETATTVIHLGKADIDRFQLVLPRQDVRIQFNTICQPLYDRIVLAKQESRTLAALRDALLPKLISGELRVKDVERFLKERGLC
jgi:type I restriction enzyme S subunit